MRIVTVIVIAQLFYMSTATAAKPVPPPTWPLVSPPPSEVALEYSRLAGERSKKRIENKIEAALEAAGRDSSVYQIDTTPEASLDFKYVFYAASRQEVCRLAENESRTLTVIDCVSRQVSTTN